MSISDTVDEEERNVEMEDLREEQWEEVEKTMCNMVTPYCGEMNLWSMVPCVCHDELTNFPHGPTDGLLRREGI